MKIYTKKGDDGTTSLYGGSRLLKSDLRVEAYGTIDELNSFIGLLVESVNDSSIVTMNRIIQNTLFDIGSIVATVDETLRDTLPQISDKQITDIETSIDKMDSQLVALNQFILPGGTESASRAHICRTICRRAERRLVALKEEEKDETMSLYIQYLNRLSDYYFVLARFLTHINKKDEIYWNKNLN